MSTQVAGDATMISQGVRTRAKSIGFWLAVFAIVVALLSLTLVPQGSGRPMDPENPRPKGTKALAQVLGQQGIEVSRISTQPELAKQKLKGDTTLVVTSSETWFSDGLLKAVAAHASGYKRIVVFGAPAYALRSLDVSLNSASPLGTTVHEPECSTPVIGKAERLEVEGTYQPGYLTQTSGQVGCFPMGATSATSGQTPWLVVVSPATPTRPEVVAVADNGMFTNEHILAADNAALGLTLLGAHPHLVWLNASADFTTSPQPKERSGWDLMPPWAQTLQLMLTWVVIAALLWRVRRFGRLVTEPLPVIIKSVETTISRGRLYERARGRSHALAALQEASRRRLSARLALPLEVDPQVLAEAVAQASGRNPQEVAWLLNDTSVGTDEDLVGRSRALAQLEEEITTR